MAENMAKRVTLLDPPPQDHSKAPIENVLDLTPVVDLGPVLQPPFPPSSRRKSQQQTNTCFLNL